MAWEVCRVKDEILAVSAAGRMAHECREDLASIGKAQQLADSFDTSVKSCLEGVDQLQKDTKKCYQERKLLSPALLLHNLLRCTRNQLICLIIVPSLPCRYTSVPLLAIKCCMQIQLMLCDMLFECA